jgi:HK97 gp10 family phage protein
MRATFKIEGLRELDAALGEMSKATARNVLRRVLIKAGQPIASAAAALAPVDTGELAGSIEVSSKIKNTVGNKEFSAVLASGGSTADARSALRDARRAAGGQGSFAEVHVGPVQAKSKKNAIKRIVQEFGSATQPPQPYMRPAWEAEKDHALEIIKRDLGAEIKRTAERAARRAAAKAAKAGL